MSYVAGRVPILISYDAKTVRALNIGDLLVERTSGEKIYVWTHLGWERILRVEELILTTDEEIAEKLIEDEEKKKMKKRGKESHRNCVCFTILKMLSAAS